MDARRPDPGHVETRIAWLAWIACAVTLAICYVGPRLLVNQGDDPMLDEGWFQNVLAMSVAAVIAVAVSPSARLSRPLRLAAALPFVHLLGMGLAWLGWEKLSSQIEGAVGLTPLLAELPIGYVLAIAVGAIALGGLVVARRRRREVVHAMVMIALVDLLLLGLWLPIAAYAFSAKGTLWSWHAELAQVAPMKLVLAVLIPPFLAAVAYTALALRRRAQLASLRTGILTGLAVVWFCAVTVRADAGEISMVVYANFLPWLFATATAAIVAITLLALASWRAAHHAPRTAQFSGTVDAHVGETVAGIAITSWLRGPEPVALGFDVATSHGTLPVPPASRVVVPLPLSSTILRVGELVPVLSGGDEVHVSGYEHHASGQPFRESSAPIPSTSGVVVEPAGAARGGLEQLALAAWRPAIAYLVVLVAIAAPALIALGRAG